MKQSIVLIGLRDAGKSSVGKLLAQTCKCDFIDTDTLLINAHKKETSEELNIKTLHLALGEERFRAKEKALISAIDISDPLVIATGGGSILDPDNRAQLKKTGKVVFLDATKETLLTRWRKDIPTFSSAETLDEDLKQYYSKRRPLCLAIADQSIDVSGLSVAEIINQILNAR